VITGLKTGGQYRFRVIAFNAVGKGEPGEVPEVLEVNDRSSELIQKSFFRDDVCILNPCGTHM